MRESNLHVRRGGKRAAMAAWVAERRREGHTVLEVSARDLEHPLLGSAPHQHLATAILTYEEFVARYFPEFNR